MPTPRSRPQRRRDTEHRLTHDIDVWVASASADGAPYLVPLSFDWDGEALRQVGLMPRPRRSTGTATPAASRFTRAEAKSHRCRGSKDRVRLGARFPGEPGEYAGHEEAAREGRVRLLHDRRPAAGFDARCPEVDRDIERARGRPNDDERERELPHGLGNSREHGSAE